jgi:hypothetical protein
MFIDDHASLLYECGLNPNLIDFYPQEENVRDGLSRRDLAFCYLISRGVDKQQAYKTAYSYSSSQQATREATQRRLKQPEVRDEMRRLIDAKIQPSPTHDAMWLQRTVIKEMLAIVQDKSSGPQNRVKAGEVVLRHIGMTINELIKAHIVKPEESNVIEDLERVLKENTGYGNTRAQLTNGQDQDPLTL